MNEQVVREALDAAAPDDALARLARGPRAIDCPGLGTGRLVFPRYREVRLLLRDPRFLCAPTVVGMLDSLPSDLRDLMAPVASWILYTDPPAHARLRALLSKAFLPRRIADLKTEIESYAGRLVRRFIEQGGGEAVDELAEPLPVRTISTLLGIDEEDHRALKVWSDDVVLITEPGLSVAQQERAASAWRALYGYLVELIRIRRRSPGEDLISALVHAESEGERLGEPELVANCIALLVGGHETTSSLLSNLLLAAMSHQDAREAASSSEEQALGFVEEVLRLYSPSKMTARTAESDVLVAGIPVEAGRRLILLQASANRDAGAFDNPLVFDPTRRPNLHVSFGYGAHACFGAALARMQGIAFFRALSEAFEKRSLGVERVDWKPSQVLRSAAAVTVSVGGLKRSVS